MPDFSDKFSLATLEHFVDNNSIKIDSCTKNHLDEKSRTQRYTATQATEVL